MSKASDFFESLESSFLTSGDPSIKGKSPVSYQVKRVNESRVIYGVVRSTFGSRYGLSIRRYPWLCMRGFEISRYLNLNPEFEETDFSFSVLGFLEPVSSVFGFFFLPMVLPVFVAVSA